MSQAPVVTCLACGQRNRVPEARLGDHPTCARCGKPLLSGEVAEIDPATHDKAIRDDLPLLVDYWAPWCGPCRMMAPNFARAAQTLQGRVRFAKLNTESYPDTSARLRITGIPLLIGWRAGHETARLPGLRQPPEIEAFARGL